MAFRTNKTPVLQEKTASGSVASFNTILQKPLVNGEFTIEAYQEGTGDPAPDNVRNIVGYSSLNMTKTVKNIKPNEGDNGTYQGVEVTYSQVDDSYTLNGTALNATTVILKVLNKLIWKKDVYYTLSVTVISGDFIIPSGTGNTYAVTLGNNVFNRIIRGATSLTADKLDGYNGSGLSFDSNVYRLVFQVFRAGTVFNNLKIKIQIEEGRAATDYEPYVTPEIKTKQLGETVYGGSYNSVSGVKSKTHIEVDMSTLSFIKQTGTNPYFTAPLSPLAVGFNGSNSCEVYKKSSVNNLNVFDNLTFIVSSNSLNIRDDDYTDTQTFTNSLVGKKFVYELVEPIESNIGATPIETYDGSNNIFCDTGNTSVVYNDLDIAKRGSFREVFKLPS